MRLLVIGPNERAAIAALKAKAASRVVDAVAVKDTPEAARKANADLTIQLPRGFYVTYTHERQPAGLLQHISISVHAKGKSPNPLAVDEILKEFGMRSFSDADSVWVEDLGSGHTAVNILQMIEAAK